MARRKKSSARKSVPAVNAFDEALARFRPLLSEDDFAALLTELDAPVYPALRENTLKANSDHHIEAWAQRYHWDYRPVPFCPTGYWITATSQPVSQTIEHRLGFYYIQDAASMLPAELFDFKKTGGPLVLDMAASPGGKTTHLVSRSQDRGLVLANDSSADRITALRIVLNNFGAINVAAARFPGERYGSWYPETFDQVLLDAPCSMQGLKTTESHPMRPITPREQAALAVRQARLLRSAFQAVRVGGQVVYSTCTLAPEENEGVLQSLLDEYPGAVQIEDLTQVLPAPAPALLADGERQFDPSVSGAARLWPHRFGTAGFFAALISKTGPVPGGTEPPPDRPLEQAGQQPIGLAQAKELADSLLQTYGFDLPALMERQELELWQRGETVYAVPQAFLTHFGGLPVQLLGLPVVEQTASGLSISHAWAARFGLSFTEGKLVLPQEHTPAWLRGEDIHGLDAGPHPAGRVVVVVDGIGRNLGRGRVQRQRLKNLLPGRAV